MKLGNHAGEEAGQETAGRGADKGGLMSSMPNTQRVAQTKPRRAGVAKKHRMALAALTVLLLAPALVADEPPARVSSAELPKALEGVGIDQRLDDQLPLEAAFVDEQGAAVTLGDYFGEKPVVLALVYYECPMLCTLELNGLLRALRALPLEPGKDFEIVTVSFDPGETPELAAKKKQEYIGQYGREGGEAAWHFLSGPQESIEALTHAAGFRYRYDPETDLFRHASAIMVLTPEGRLSKYFYGIEYSARDLRLGLVEASAGKIGSAVDEILLYCFHYDPETGKYGVVIMNVLRLAGVATVVLLVGFIAVMLRRDRRRRRFVMLGTR